MIDTHLHILNPKLINYGWLNTAPSLLRTDFYVEHIEIEARKAGVSNAILIQACNHFSETEYLIREKQKNPFIIGVVGWIDLLQPHFLKKRIKEIDTSILKGVRHLSHIEKDIYWLLKKEVFESFRILEEHQIVADLVGTNAAHLDCAINIAKKFQDLKIVIDHLNQPPQEYHEQLIWQEKMIELSHFQNVYLKISGLGTVINNGPNWSSYDINSWINFCYNNFGKNRILIGSDWPICLLAGGYTSTIEKYREALSNFDYDVQESIFYKNAIDVYQLKINVH